MSRKVILLVINSCDCSMTMHVFNQDASFPPWNSSEIGYRFNFYVIFLMGYFALKTFAQC